MKKIIFRIIFFLLILIFSFAIYWNLPIEITRNSEIKLGDKIISNIKKFQQKNNKLPNNDDWKTLEKLGFKIDFSGSKPSYETDNNGNFEIVYLEGFDGPYLMWNSHEKKWKIDFPKVLHDKNYEKIQTLLENKNEKIIYLVSQTGLDNYAIDFYAINKSDTISLFQDFINDAKFSPRNYTTNQYKNLIEIISSKPTESKYAKTKSGINVILKN